jgi:hypothetical protein
MDRGIAAIALGAALLAGACAPDAAPVGNEIANQLAAPAAPAAPAAIATSAAVAASPLAQWLVGSWSADKSCATDFIAHYHADGSLQYGEDSGVWTLAGATVTETITARFAMDGDAAAKLPEPERRTYTVRQIDPGHGTITYQGRKIAIQRC